MIQDGDSMTDLQLEDQVTFEAQEWAGCDSCSARAQVKASMPFGELWFCLHHYNKNAQALTNKGAIAKLLNISKD